jgi:hypothetical protein
MKHISADLEGTRAPCRYRKLWQAVFMTAIEDALHHRYTSTRRAGMDWLFSDLYAEDRRIVMDRAGIRIDGWRLKEAIERADRKALLKLIPRLLRRHAA